MTPPRRALQAFHTVSHAAVPTIDAQHIHSPLLTVLGPFLRQRHRWSTHIFTADLRLLLRRKVVVDVEQLANLLRLLALDHVGAASARATPQRTLSCSQCQAGS